MTYQKAMTEAEECMRKAAICDANVDAWYLLQFVLREEEGRNVDRTWFFMNRSDEIKPETLRRYEELVQKRAGHIPLQHLTGEQEFMGYTFEVNAHVLVPRQDTEILVEEALKHLKPGMEVLDMCTGSGCILLSLLKEMPNCKGTGADLSKEALEVAAGNRDRLQCDAELIQSDLFETVEGIFDVIVSNPPYIATEEIETLAEEVRIHEPRMALDGRADGLYYYRKIIEQSGSFLKNNGWLLFEIGYDQGEAVTKLMEQAGFCQIEVVKDLAGLDRVVKGCMA